MKKNKYKNVAISKDGSKYDSKAESKRHNELKILEKGGYIKDLKTQVKYVLQPSFKIKYVLQPSFTIQGKTIEGETIKEITYTADFTYYDVALKKEIVEDVKNPCNAKQDKAFSIKKKLLLHKWHQERTLNTIFRVVEVGKTTNINDYEVVETVIEGRKIYVKAV